MDKIAAQLDLAEIIAESATTRQQGAALKVLIGNGAVAAEATTPAVPVAASALSTITDARMQSELEQMPEALAAAELAQYPAEHEVALALRWLDLALDRAVHDTALLRHFL